MKQLYWLAFTLFILLTLYCYNSAICLKEDFTSLPQCDNDSTCNEGSEKCDSYLSTLKKTEKIPDEISDNLNSLNNYVSNILSSLKKLEKQAKKCK